MVFMHRQPCDICLSFMVYGFMVYLLPRRRIHKEEMPLQSWVVCSIEVEVSVIPRTAWSKACQRKETQYFPLLCSYQVPFQHVQYETDKMSGVCSRDSNCSALCFLLRTAELLKAKDDRSRFFCQSLMAYCGRQQAPKEAEHLEAKRLPLFCCRSCHWTSL